MREWEWSERYRIVMDADEQLGQPIISNDLVLTKPHHEALEPI